MRAAVALGLAVMVTACARTAPPAAEPTAAATHGVGYVRMDELVRKHPLYGQLARYDENIEALNLSTIAPRAVAAGPDVARQEAALQAQLAEATKRTNDLLQSKSKTYEQRESDAIAEALRQAGSGGTSVAAVTAQVERTAGDQVRSAGAQAQRDLDTYRKQLEAQDTAQVEALQRTLAGRADRTYRAKLDELNTKEAALSLKLATDDAAERLSLRAKLSSLALDDAAREAAKSQLDGLDKKEADAIAAQRAEDQATLTALQTQLRTGVQADGQRQIADIHSRSIARYRAREAELRGQFAVPTGPLLGGDGKSGTRAAQADPNLPAPLRAKIQALHDNYTKAFQKDAGATIADFNKTRDLLKARYDALHGLNDDAARNVQSEILSLQRKREDLYEQMVAQIGREVKTIAHQRGVSLVLSNVNAPGGIDLTDDALKDIETLHE